MSDDGTITVATQNQVLRQTDNTHYMIRRTDWKRFCRSLGDCDVAGTNSYGNACWAFVGVAASGILAVIALYSVSGDLPTWVKPTTWAITGAAAVLAVACFFMARRISDGNRKLVTQIYSEMTELETTFADPNRVSSGGR